MIDTAMAAGQYPITLEQYATFTLPITWEDQNGTPIDITGYTAALDVKDAQGNLIVSLTTGNGDITLGGIAGTITLTLPASTTSTLQVGVFNYDLILTSGSNVVTRLLEGSFTVVAGVTPS